MLVLRTKACHTFKWVTHNFVRGQYNSKNKINVVNDNQNQTIFPYNLQLYREPSKIYTLKMSVPKNLLLWLHSVIRNIFANGGLKSILTYTNQSALLYYVQYFKPLSQQTAMPQRLYSILKTCQCAVGSLRTMPKNI